MEMILGLIEDLLDKLEGDDEAQSADAKASLSTKKSQFISQLQDLVDSGNGQADEILDRLKNAELD